MVTVKQRRENIRKKLEKARRASPSGTTGGATGRAGAKGSQQARGGGTTQIVVDSSGKAKVVSFAEGERIKQAEVVKVKQQIEQKKTEAIQKQKRLREDVITSLFRRQGFKVSETKSQLKGTKDGRQIVVAKKGFRTVEAPISATIKKEFISERRIPIKVDRKKVDRDIQSIDINKIPIKEEKKLPPQLERFRKIGTISNPEKQDLFKRFGKEFVNLVSSPVRGAAKIAEDEAKFQAAFKTGNRFELEKIAQDQKEKDRLNDPDVQAAVIVAALSASPLPIQTAVGAGFGTLGVGQFILGEKTPETAAQVTIASLGFIPAVSKLPIKVEQFKIPTATGEVVIRTIGFQTKKGRAQPLLSFVDGEARILTPNVANELSRLPDGFEIKPASALETKILQKALRNIGKEPRAREAIPVIQSILRKTRTTKSKFAGELPTKTKRLDEKGTQALLDIAKEEEALVFGSFARKAQQDKPEGLPGDLDIRLKPGSTDVDVKRVQAETVKRLQDLGLEAKAKGEDGVAVKVGDKFEKVVEYKTELGIGEGEEVPARVLGFDKFGKPIKVKTVQVSSLAEETRATAQGVARLRKRGDAIDVFPPEHRVKDVKSFVDAAETLRQSQRIPRPGLKRDIELIKELFPNLEAVKSAAQRTTEGKILLADFSPSAINPNTSLKGVTFVSPKTIPASPRSSPRVSPVSPKSSPIISPRTSPKSSPQSSPSPSPRISVSPSPASPSPSPDKSFSPFSPSPSPSPRSSPGPSPISPKPSPQPSPRPSPSPSPLSPSPSPQPKPKPSPLQKTTDKKRRIVVLSGGQQRQPKESFTPQVRKRGKFINLKPQISRRDSYKIARENVQNTASASLRVLSKSGKPIPIDKKSGSLFPKRDFRVSKKESGVIIERRNRRIKSKGELGEITKRGIAAKKSGKPRKRKLFSRFGGV